MNSFNVELLSETDFRNLTSHVELPIWQNPRYCRIYSRCLYLAAFRGSTLEGVWVIPIMHDQSGQTLAKRPWRMLPYASPVLFHKTGLRRRTTAEVLFLELTRHVDYVALPLSPRVKDISILQNHQALIEWRHTHVLDRDWINNQPSRRVSNHLRHALSQISVVENTDVAGFAFWKAIKGESNEGVQKRAEFGSELLASGDAFYMDAIYNGQVVGQAFVMREVSTSYLLHLWSSRGTVRGISHALISAIAQACFRNYSCTSLDLEGSVIPGIDAFFYGLQGAVLPYGFLMWSRDGNLFTDTLKLEIMPAVRLLNR